MKKIILLLILLFQLSFVFGQNSQWGSWSPVSCYNRLSTSVLGNGYVPSIKEYSWQVRIKSTYSKKVTFNMTWIVGGERLSIGQVTLTPNESYGHTPRYFKSSSENILVEVSEVCFEGQDCYKYGYADCNGNQAKISNNSTSTNSTNQTNNSNQQTTQPNDLTEYNRSKAEMEQKMQQQNQEIANRNAEAQRQQQLLKQQQEQQRQQQLQQGINQVTRVTVDLVTYFANRKNALRNSLSNEDGQALLDIVNSENPTNYTQNIIQIFKDLGYTLRETERKDGYVIITLNNDVANINDFMLIFVRPASYDYYNSINFSYHRKQKLREQLAVLGNNLKGSDGLELQGISQSNAQKKDQQEQKNLNEKTKRATDLIAFFEKNNYWNSSDRSVFSYAKDIGEQYEDEKSLNNIDEAIRYYKKAVTVPIDSLTVYWKNDKNMIASVKNDYAKVCFKVAALIEDKNGQEAIEYYNKSSMILKTVSYVSYSNIGKIYKFGKGGVSKDWLLSIEYFEKAANEGNAAAMVNLGAMYGTGGPNLEKDESKSKKWYKKACKEDKKFCR